MTVDPAGALVETLLYHPGLIPDAVSSVQPCDLPNQDHRLAFEGMREIWESGVTPDHFSLADYLHKVKGLSAEKAQDLVERLDAGNAVVGTVPSIKGYANIIRRESKKHKLQAWIDIAQSKLTENADPDLLWNELSESLVSIQVNNSAIDISPSVDSVREFLDRATVERQSSAD